MTRSLLCGLLVLGGAAFARAGELDREKAPPPATVPSAVKPGAATELDKESPEAAHRYRGGWGGGYGYRGYGGYGYGGYRGYGYGGYGYRGVSFGIGLGGFYGGYGYGGYGYGGYGRGYRSYSVGYGGYYPYLGGSYYSVGYAGYPSAGYGLGCSCAW